MATVPTKKQYRQLRVLMGLIILTPGFREWQSAVNRGWVEPAWGHPLEPNRDSAGRRTSWPPLRISADGLRALAAAVDRYGWPKKSEDPA